MNDRRKSAYLFAMHTVLAGALCCVFSCRTQAQQASLPSAPPVYMLAQNNQTPIPPMPIGPPPPMPPALQPPPSTGPLLTLAQAEQMAIRNNPHISIAHLLALAQAQVTRQVFSAYMPMASTTLDAVDANNNGRITGAGTLNSPRMLDKAAGGLTVSQLITDFGRTHNLVLSARSAAKAQLENEVATDLDITLTVDQAFYHALAAQADLRAAEETVRQRQATADQVNALTQAKLRSDVDLAFADVQLSQAKLLELNAKNQSDDAMAALNTVLGSEQNHPYTLVDETSVTPAPPPSDAEPLVRQAFAARPDLAALNDDYASATHYSKAQRDLWMPTVSALAMVGGTPVRDDLIKSSWYSGAGASINIPVFNGFLFNAQAREAKLRAGAAQQQVRNLRDDIARDVRTAVLNAQTAFERIDVTLQMLNQSNLALDLSQARYKIGLSSIVEITQAQLAQTDSLIAYTNARYSYQTALAVLRYQLGQ
ncbi:MAG: TolC family protein [Terracidiphilus sp.]